MTGVRLILAAFLWLCLFSPVRAADDVVVRTTLKPDDNAVIGQRVQLWIDVLFHGDMPYPPRVAPPVIPGAQIFRFETQAVTMTEQIDGDSYSGKRFEFAVYPRRGGNLTVPPASVTLFDRQQNETGTIMSPAARLTVSVPPGLDASRPVIASTEVTMTEQWSPAPTTPFKTGDALRRTVTRRAVDVPGLAMPEFDFTAPEGVRVYVDAPGITDKTDRGSLTGERIDRATYVFEAAGAYALSALSQPWWDLDHKTAHTIALRGLMLNVTATAGTEGAASPKNHAIGMVAGATVIGAAILGGLLYAPARRRLVAPGRHGERATFKALLRACAQNDATTIYRALTEWRRHIPVRGRAIFNDTLTSSGAAALIETLEQSLFGAGNDRREAHPLDSLALARKLRAVRRQLYGKSHNRKPNPFPPLNPA